MGSKRHGPIISDLRQIVSENWCPPINPYDEVYPGIYIGDSRTALDINLLQTLNISHVLNAAQGNNPIRYVNTSQESYLNKGLNVKFLGIPAMDITAYQLHPFFITSSDFIQNSQDQKGKILVHCREGISRSSTLVVAYLMMKKEMSAVDAIKLVRSKRQIFPNDGFLEQLCDLDLRLRGERSYKGR